MRVTYVAGWNSPGYLPESEPQRFDTSEEAFAYLAGAVEEFWEQEEGGCLDGLASGHAMVKWLTLHKTLHETPPLKAPWTKPTGDGSLEFWVHVHAQLPALV